MTGWIVGACRHGRIAGSARIGRTRLRAGIAGLALLAPAASPAQTPPPAGSPPAGSLVTDPQQGATPRPLTAPPTSAALPAAPPVTPLPAPSPAAVIPGPAAVAPVTVPRGPGRLATDRFDPLGVAQPGGLPMPSGDPLRIDMADDPILAIARTQTAPAAFNRAIAEAVERNPALGEVDAQVDEADAARREARARALPVADVSLTRFQVISRAFSNDPLNILERSRPRERTDGLIRVQQPIVDFGASLNRIRASEARLELARTQVEDTGTQVALRAVSAWYSVYGYRVLVHLAEAFSANQRALKASVEERVRQGAAAPGDVAQVDSYIAASDAQRADFTRQLVSAEAQYAAVIGEEPPVDLGRAPVPSLDGIVRGSLAGDTEKMPAVRVARLGAVAARRDARALKADRLPQLGASIDAGRYGVIETDRDYDVRGSVTLSMRLGGGTQSRIDQAEARVARAEATARRTEIETRRDAEIALSDVAALEDAQAALAENYVAGRRSRDVLAERFRVARGTVFDLLAAQNNYFGVASRYIQSTIELDTARYALLARTGRLLPALGIDPAALEKTR